MLNRDSEDFKAAFEEGYAEGYARGREELERGDATTTRFIRKGSIEKAPPRPAVEKMLQSLHAGDYIPHSDIKKI